MKYSSSLVDPEDSNWVEGLTALHATNKIILLLLNKSNLLFSLALMDEVVSVMDNQPDVIIEHIIHYDIITN